MKAQFATIEAVIGLFMALATAAYIADSAYKYSLQAYVNASLVKRGDEMYDFSIIAQENSTLRNCLISQNYSCISKFLSLFGEAYGTSMGVCFGNACIGKTGSRPVCVFVGSKLVCMSSV